MKSMIVKSAMAAAVCVLSAACSMKKEMPAEPPMEKPVEQAMPAKEMPVDVKDVQKKLNMKGARLRVDGQMGGRTKKAISSFQMKNNLPVTGELDAMTLEKLNG